MIGVATLTSVAYAWRRRDREHAVLAAFFGVTLAIDLVRLQLVGAPIWSMAWYADSFLFLVQFASVPALTALVLAKHFPWPVLLGWAVASVIFAAHPRSMVWLYKACDIAAVSGALVYAILWVYSAGSRSTLASTVVLLVIGVTAIGVIAHATLSGDSPVWRIHSAAIACILLGIAAAQLRGAFEREKA